jgi:hypothetical protein
MQCEPLHEHSTLTRSFGRYPWRRKRGLLTVSDLVLRYRAVRSPAGSYRTPLPLDYIPGGSHGK